MLAENKAKDWVRLKPKHPKTNPNKNKKKGAEEAYFWKVRSQNGGPRLKTRIKKRVLQSNGLCVITVVALKRMGIRRAKNNRLNNLSKNPHRGMLDL